MGSQAEYTHIQNEYRTHIHTQAPQWDARALESLVDVEGGGAGGGTGSGGSGGGTVNGEGDHLQEVDNLQAAGLIAWLGRD